MIHPDKARAMGIAEARSFLDSMAQYFEHIDAGGEDRAIWANIYNAENCRRIILLLPLPIPTGDAREMARDWLEADQMPGIRAQTPQAPNLEVTR